MNELVEKIRLKIRKKYIKLTHKLRRKKIYNNEFTIISNNCWGGFIYQSYGLKYNSPTIGLYFTAKDYIKFIKELKKYLSLELTFIEPKDSKNYKNLDVDFPIGKLGDIEIYFMHYKSKKEAKDKWDRRRERINWKNIIIKFSNQNDCTIKEINDFINLKYKNKICFVNKKELNKKGTIYIKQLFKTDDIKASFEPFGNSKYININELINNLEEENE